MSKLAAFLNNSHLGVVIEWCVWERGIVLNCIEHFFLSPSSVQNSERGKKIGSVMVTTSRNVVQTGKAVGKAPLPPGAGGLPARLLSVRVRR